MCMCWMHAQELAQPPLPEWGSLQTPAGCRGARCREVLVCSCC